MNSEKVAQFMQLAGVQNMEELANCPVELRKLGAQLLLSETLEYVIKGLGITPVVNQQAIDHPDGLEYRINDSKPLNALEMIDGLADVAYTMYWNAIAFGLPLEEAYEMVCDNNLEKFVPLDPAQTESDQNNSLELSKAEWHCNQNVEWPEEVVCVRRQKVGAQWYAVGTDANGKVRKPSTYRSVDLGALLEKTGR